MSHMKELMYSPPPLCLESIWMIIYLLLLLIFKRFIEQMLWNLTTKKDQI